MIKALLLLVLAAVTLIPRWLVLDSFATVDESTWLMRSANFYYALGQRDFEQTIYAYHPAVTTMWIGVAAIILDFPEYRGLGQGYFEKEWQFSEFLIANDYHPQDLLKTSRQITVAINTFLIICIFFLLRRLLGWFIAFSAIIIFAFDPFLLGHTRILAHEGMLTLLVIISVSAFLNFLFFVNHKWYFLVFSATAAALAVLTKSSATILVPFIGLIYLIVGFEKIRGRAQQRASEVWALIKHLGVAWGAWLIVFIMIYVLVWPGMWVDPSKMLLAVYGNAFSYAFQGYNLEYAETLENSETADVEPTPTEFPRILVYLYEIPWHTTPVIWAGLCLAIILIVSRKIIQPPEIKLILITFLLLALLFLLMMSLAKGRLESRYIMVTYSSLGLAASIGIAYFSLQAQKKLYHNFLRIIPATIFISLLTFQALLAYKFFPYYFNYSNPWVEGIEEGIQTPVIGYGEGLELAAGYLAQKPESENLTAMSWYGIGPFSFFFPGWTENMFPSAAWTPDLIERLKRSDYLVIYEYHQQQRQMPAKLLRDIATVKSEKDIWLNGVEYIKIYRVNDLPEAVFIPDP